MRWLDGGLIAVDPARRTMESLRDFHAPACAILSIGKASAGMSRGAVSTLGSRVKAHLVITPVNTDSLPPHVRRVVGDHPVPGENSLQAGLELEAWMRELPPTMPLLVLLSGGGSALVELPVEGMPGNDLCRLNEWLLASGLDIRTINSIRARFSRLKRGGLLRLAGKREVVGLLISDVPGDDPATIASGPLLPGTCDWPQHLVPDWLQRWHRQFPMPLADPVIARCSIRFVARNADLRLAILRAVADDGICGHDCELLQGDAEEKGREIGKKLLGSKPGVYLWGGETTVRLPGNPGKGGRNQHLALAAACEFAGQPDVLLLALGTDGIDGNTQDAGALVDGETVQRIRDAGLDPGSCLRGADSNRALSAAEDVIHTGPTGTNVSDIVLAWKR